MTHEQAEEILPGIVLGICPLPAGWHLDVAMVLALGARLAVIDTGVAEFMPERPRPRPGGLWADAGPGGTDRQHPCALGSCARQRGDPRGQRGARVHPRAGCPRSGRGCGLLAGGRGDPGPGRGPALHRGRHPRPLARHGLSLRARAETAGRLRCRAGLRPAGGGATALLPLGPAVPGEPGATGGPRRGGAGARPPVSLVRPGALRPSRRGRRGASWPRARQRRPRWRQRRSKPSRGAHSATRGVSARPWSRCWPRSPCLACAPARG